MRIRFSSHHARCSQCVKHRLIIKKLGHCPPALRAQQAELQKHLERQLKDRQVYWAARARSRLGATTLGGCEITIIIDSMDAPKTFLAPQSINEFKGVRLFCSSTAVQHNYVGSWISYIGGVVAPPCVHKLVQICGDPVSRAHHGCSEDRAHQLFYQCTS